MLRRSPAVLAALAAALVLAARPSSALASGITADLTPDGSAVLTNTSNHTIDSVFALIEPPGKIATPSTSGPADPNAHPMSVGPMTVYDDSKGFDRSAIQFGLANGQLNGQEKQGMGIIFGDGGLQPGGQLHFTLKLDPSYTGDLNLQLVDSLQTLNPLTAGGLSLSALAASTGGGGSVGATSGGGSAGGTTAPPTVQTPEPLSLLFWSASLAGLALARGRRPWQRAGRRA